MILPSDFDIRMGGRQTIDEKNTIDYGDRKSVV